MFEVGKKYKYVDDDIYTCIASFENKGWMLGSPSPHRSTPFTYDWTQGWVEYKEPKKRTWWINIYKYRDGGIRMGGAFDNKETAVIAAHMQTGESLNYLETVEFTYTEKMEKSRA